ncbi:MAG: hypothetical protein WD341_14125 [Tistlia sp.]|uniref:hypothetical protein n=1 Tax=Tistlia sp. TaxID=3057121 RepID=UPI0034A1C9EB
MDCGEKRRSGLYARAIVRCRRAASAVQRAEAAGLDLAPARAAVVARNYRELLAWAPATAAELLAFGDQAEAYLRPRLDGGAGDGRIDPESATLVRLIEGQRAVLG